MSARRIIFHIGLAKTGTTSFQHFCHRHRGGLARHGILYPKRQLGRGCNHTPLVASYIAHRPQGPTVALRWAPRAQAVRSLLAEIEAGDAATVLISSEHFSTHFDRSEALELATDFGAHDCSILLALRDTHGRFLSSYNTHVTAGGRLPIEDYARSVLVPGTRFMSMRETVLIWQEAFGRERIRLVDYEASADIVVSLLHDCGFDVAALPAWTRMRRRGSLGPAAIETLRRANAIIASRQLVPADRSVAAWVQLSAFSILCRRRLARVGASDPGPWTVSVETMRALDAFAAADRQWLAATYGFVMSDNRARDRMIVAGARPDSEADMRRAEALVARVGRGLWAPSQALVGLWDRIADARAARTPSHRE